MRFGMLTGGGDCPGLNAVMRAVVRKVERSGHGPIIGFQDGWRGVIDNQFVEMDIEYTRGLLTLGGTVLGTTRLTPYMVEGGLQRVKEVVAEHKLDGLVVIGGEGTLSCANQVGIDLGIGIIGVPKTIDNDVGGTEMTFGFDTAVAVATAAIGRLHTTAESHDRIIVCEVMGRHVGHIATWSGIAGGASITLIPEEPFDIDEICKRLTARHLTNRFASIVVVAEGAVPVPGTLEIAEPEVDEFGHKRLGGIGFVVAGEIEKRTGIETRVTVLGHVQRGGEPTAHDRVLCTRFGVAAAEAAIAQDWQKMVALQCGSIVRVPIADAIKELKIVREELRNVARAFQPPLEAGFEL